MTITEEETTKLLLHEIDFGGLERELTARLGVRDLKFTGKIVKTGRHDTLRIEFESNELKNQTGIMYSVYKSFKISNFSNSWSEEEKMFWIVVHFSYVYKGGGYNGTEICTAYYAPETKLWFFKEGVNS